MKNYKYYICEIKAMKAISHNSIRPAEGDPCGHGAGAEVVADGEIVCRVCGVVKGADERRVASLHSRRCVFLEWAAGGKKARLPGGRYVRGGDPDLDVISRVTQSLGMGSQPGGDVWRWYRRLRKSGIPLTKAKLMVLAFHGACRCYGVGVDEGQLAEAVRVHLGVKNVPSYLKAVMEASAHLEGGEMVLRRIGYLDIDRNEYFGLRSRIRPLNGRHTAREVEGVAGVAKNIQPALRGPRAAGVAVRMARRRCGV